MPRAAPSHEAAQIGRRPVEGSARGMLPSGPALEQPFELIDTP
jgi:hypothetical protein